MIRCPQCRGTRKVNKLYFYDGLLSVEETLVCGLCNPDGLVSAAVAWDYENPEPGSTLEAACFSTAVCLFGAMFVGSAALAGIPVMLIRHSEVKAAWEEKRRREYRPDEKL